jgi:hypothetical protein
LTAGRRLAGHRHCRHTDDAGDGYDGRGQTGTSHLLRPPVELPKIIRRSRPIRAAEEPLQGRALDGPAGGCYRRVRVLSAPSDHARMRPSPAASVGPVDIRAVLRVHLRRRVPRSEFC